MFVRRKSNKAIKVLLLNGRFSPKYSHICKRTQETECYHGLVSCNMHIGNSNSVICNTVISKYIINVIVHKNMLYTYKPVPINIIEMTRAR